MAETKPRWEVWENICVKIAFEERIQLKIIAIALERSVTSISKKIKKLGLREPTSHSGRLKGKKNSAPWAEKIPADIAKMINIIKTYAPLKLSQKGQLALREGQWAQPHSLSLKDLKEGLCIGRVRQKLTPFSLSFPLDYVLSQDLPSERGRKEKAFGNPLYVSLRHVEEWAASKGFQSVKEDLKLHGFFYWKEGKHFSKTQLLIYVNQIRLDKKLQPMALYEEERKAYAER